jgi:hypothetical protein
MSNIVLSHYFSSNFYFIQDLRSKKMISLGTKRDGMYYFTNMRLAWCQMAKSTSQLWHRWLGHLSNKILSFLSNNLFEICCSDSEQCFVCPLAKETRLPFLTTQISSTASFTLLHIDIWGGYRTTSINGACYFLIVVGDYTRSTWVYLKQHQSKAHSLLQCFINIVENQFSTSIKIICSDNGLEFIIPSFYSKASSMRLVMSLIHNKMVLLNASIVNFSICLELYSFKPTCPTFLGRHHLNYYLYDQ